MSDLALTLTVYLGIPITLAALSILIMAEVIKDGRRQVEYDKYLEEIKERELRIIRSTLDEAPR